MDMVVVRGSAQWQARITAGVRVGNEQEGGRGETLGEAAGRERPIVIIPGAFL
jgi:hypothetical protein